MKLSESVKVNLDEDTCTKFQRRATRAGCSTSELLRDMVCVLEHGLTWGEHVAQSRRAALNREGSSTGQSQVDSIPPAASLTVVNARS